MKTNSFCSLGCTGLLLLLSACGPSARPRLTQHTEQHERGLAENPRRLALGMRPIDENWICFRCVGARDEWISDPINDAAAIKSVDRDAEDNAISEVDVYWSGKKYIDIEGDPSEEELRVFCDWKTREISITYMGDDRALEKAFAKLPPFSDETRSAYVDLVTSVVKKWESYREAVKP